MSLFLKFLCFDSNLGPSEARTIDKHIAFSIPVSLKKNVFFNLEYSVRRHESLKDEENQARWYMSISQTLRD